MEATDDTKIAAATTNGPEQIRLVVGTDHAGLPVRSDDLGAEQVVDRQSVFAIQSPETAA